MEYIDLANAHVTQYTKNNVKSEWSIEKNITNEILGTLPSRLNESEIFHILEMARKYELTAFNVGIGFGKDQYKKIHDSELRILKEKLNLIIAENERLADALEININLISNN